MADIIDQIGFTIYVYCTDFVINLANLTHLSYYEINAIIFCLVWPIVTVLAALAFMIQKIRLRRIKKKTG
jgi:hypothetical protein